MTSLAEPPVTGPDSHDPETRARVIGFFQAEAGQRCEALIATLASEQQPGGNALSDAIANARAIRGGAAVADLTAISQLGGHIERILKALHGRRLAWTPTLSSQLRAGASHLLEAIGRARHWGENDDRGVGRAAGELARYDVVARRRGDNLIVPIAKLFHSDDGPHIVFMPATPQTQFEQQLRALAERGARGGGVPAPPGERAGARRTPTSPRGHELRALLGASVSKMSASFAAAESEPVPIETLLYSGAGALKRARELARVIRARGPENARELLPELIDLLDLAAAH